MAAPVIAWSAEYVGADYISAATTTTWSIGDVALLFVASDGDNTTSAAQSGLGNNLKAFTILSEVSNGTAQYSGWFYRWVDGSESTWPNCGFQWLGNESEQVYGILMQITGVTREYPLITPAAVVATTANPNPPAVPALKESRDVLYLVATSHDHTDTWASDPSGYATVQNGNSGTGSGDCGGAVAYLAVTGSDAVDPARSRTPGLRRP